MTFFQRLISELAFLFGYVFTYSFYKRIKKDKDLFLLSPWLRHCLSTPHNKVYFASSSKITGGQIYVGNNTVFQSHLMLQTVTRDYQQEKPIIKIGENCNFGEYAHITAFRKIIIGDGVLTGRKILISDNSHGYFTKEDLTKSPNDRQITSKGPILIDNNVWICDNVCILGGVHIGEGAIIAANAVVTHDIPAFSLATGVPASVIRTLNVQ